MTKNSTSKLLNIFFNRRSIRRFSSKSVPEEIVQKIIETEVRVSKLGFGTFDFGVPSLHIGIEEGFYLILSNTNSTGNRNSFLPFIEISFLEE